MAEKIVTLRQQQVCDLCGHRIKAGERCRLVRDDFDPAFRYFEHLRCPNAVTRAPSTPPGQDVTPRQHLTTKRS